MSMLRTMVTQLVKHERIETTIAKAKLVSRLANNNGVVGKRRYTLCSKTYYRFCAGVMMSSTSCLRSWLTDSEIEPVDTVEFFVFLTPMAYVEFIDRMDELRQAKPRTPQLLQMTALDPWTRSRLSRQFALPKEDKCL